MKPVLIALDIGATKTIIGRVVGERVKAERRLATVKLFRKGGNINPLVTEVRKFWKPNTQAIAVGFAGAVSGDRIMSAPNFSSDLIPKRFALGRLLADNFNVPVRVMNDAECFTMGEASFGAARHRRRVVGITIGSGVGGGIVIDGAPYRGAHSLAGEFGHLPFPSADFLCGCGQPGHLETILSGPGLVRLYAMAGGREGEGDEIESRARRGDPAARQSLAVLKEALVHLLLTVLVVWDPDIIVIGGGVSKISSLLVAARRLTRQRLGFRPLRRVPIVPSLLHDHSVLLGAASLSLSFLSKKERVKRLSFLRAG